MTNTDIIEKFINKSLLELITPDYDFFYTGLEFPQGMIDTHKPEKEGIYAWRPIKSTVSDIDILKLENKIGHSYPESYKAFLKHTHFVELCNLSEVWFFGFPSESWSEIILDRIFDGWPKEDVLDKGLIPFAEYSDWGLTCFNTKYKDEQAEYEIWVWDHDDPDNPKYLAKNFIDLLQKITAGKLNFPNG